MGVLGHKGIDVRQTANRLIFEASLKDANGAVVSTGTTNVRLYELQDDGDLKSYDWNDNTFKTTALTTENSTATHQQGNNNTTNTGIWTKVLSTLTGFTVGALYYCVFENTNAMSPQQERKFQFGSLEGDHVGGGNSDSDFDGGTEFLPVDAHKVEFSVSAGTNTVKKPNDSTTAYTKTVTTDPAAEPITGSS